MQAVRRLVGSTLLAFISLLLVIGGLSLALAESYIPAAATATQTETPVLVFFTPVNTLPVSAASASFTPTVTETLPPPPTSCPPPGGWIPIKVQALDTLDSLAIQYKTPPDLLRQANCLFSSDLTPGTLLYVPPVPTPTRVPCGPPPGWVLYTVQAGNTLFSLGQAFGVSVSQLQQANCMPYSQTTINVGRQIWVPNVATRTPTLTPISIIFPTLTWTVSPLPTFTVTFTPSPTWTPSPTLPPSPTATFTSTNPPPTPPPTATPSITAFPTSTP
ncbi:MAG: hypothetical protein Fur0043_18330 [Anaerolineales bacterium]